MIASGALNRSRHAAFVPFRKLFLSRWSALLWAGGVLWTAADTIGFGPPATPDRAIAIGGDADAAGMDVDAADLAALANVMKDD